MDIVRDFVRKQKNNEEIFKNNTKMARMLMESEDGQHLTGSLEAVRLLVRKAKGVAGKAARAYQDPDFFDLYTTLDQNQPAKEYDSSPFIIPEENVLVLSDLQYPYYCRTSLEAAIAYASENYQVDAILINGDWFDFYQASDFMKDPRLMRISDELDGGCAILNMLIKTFNCPIYFKYGNHEERFDNYLYKKAGELKGIPEFELEACIKRRVPEDITIIKDMRTVRLGDLNAVHGHEWRRGMFSPVSPARGLWNRALCSTFQGDCHQPSSHYEKNLEGSIFVTYSTGCLCDLKPRYMPNNKWLNGFAFVTVNQSTGEFIFQNKVIKKGKVY